MVRSAKITAEVLAQAARLKVIGRAGIGGRKHRLDAATSAGVLVMNTPGGNAVSVAEHTLGADAVDGALDSAGDRVHQERPMGAEEISGARSCAGKRSA